MYATYAMYEFGWTPRQWAELPYDERMLVIAMIQYRDEETKKQEKQAEADAKRKAHR